MKYNSYTVTALLCDSTQPTVLRKTSQQGSMPRHTMILVMSGQVRSGQVMRSDSGGLLYSTVSLQYWLLEILSENKDQPSDPMRNAHRNMFVHSESKTRFYFVQSN